MTTIVYDHKSKTIATDGRTTKDGVVISDDVEKCTTVDDVRFFFAGNVCDEELFISGFFGEEIKLVPQCRAMVIQSDKVYICTYNNECILEKYELKHNDELGSGGLFALAALDFGKSAAEAVEYACSKDVYSGGTIRLYRIVEDKEDD